MEVFTLIRKHLERFGLEIANKLPEKYPFNVRNATIFSLVYVTVGLTIFSLNEDSTFDERTDVLSQCGSFIGCGLDYTIFIMQTSKLSEFVNRFADIVEKSE